MASTGGARKSLRPGIQPARLPRGCRGFGGAGHRRIITIRGLNCGNSEIHDVKRPADTRKALMASGSFRFRLRA